MAAFQISERARKVIRRALSDRATALYEFANKTEMMFGHGTAYDEMRAEARYIATLAAEFDCGDDDAREIS